jgi:hypothetical protein
MDIQKSWEISRNHPHARAFRHRLNRHTLQARTMNTSTAIVIAAAWGYAAVNRLAPNITDLGIKRTVQRAWLLTAIALAFDVANKIFL